MSTVLVVEDDDALRDALAVVLNARQLDTIEVGTGETAIAEFKKQSPDLILLDLGLPGLDGFDVLAVVRAVSDVPVVVLTVDDDRDRKLRALESGADDYITKPFDTDELVARIGASLRRRVGLNPGVIDVQAAGVVIDLAGLRATHDSDDVHLTPTEWRILELLVRASGALVTYPRLLRELRSANDRDAAAIRMHMNHIRRKLGDPAERPLLIGNEPGLGYRWLPGSDTPRS